MNQKFTIIILFLFLPFIVFGQWIQIGDNINGEAAEDRFGRSVSISHDGKILAIGGFFNDGNGLNSGHVRVFENIGGAWNQIGDDIDGEAAFDASGFSLDINNEGTIIAIGARSNSGINGQNSGQVRVFENIGGTWAQIGDDIDGEAIDDLSGQSVNISGIGNIVAIGANSNDGNGFNSGHVRVYENIGGVWTQIGDDIDGEATEDESGLPVTLNNDGNIVAIGAFRNDGANGEDSGHVRVFENIGGTWSQIGDDIDGEAAADNFGISVSLNNDGNVVAIGASGAEGVNGVNSGNVRVFENVGGVWNQIGDDIDGEAAGDSFGQAVSLNNDGDIVAVGGWNNDANGAGAGHVRVFKNIAGDWTQIGDDIDGEAAEDGSGIYTALSANGSVVAIGAWRNDTNGIDAGQVKVYGNALLSVENNSFGEEISLYPNPTYGISTITLGSAYSNVELIVYDSTGKIIKRETHTNTDSLEINTQNYAAGIYLLKITFDEKYSDLKLIKR